MKFNGECLAPSSLTHRLKKKMLVSFLLGLDTLMGVVIDSLISEEPSLLFLFVCLGGFLTKNFSCLVVSCEVLDLAV